MRKTNTPSYKQHIGRWGERVAERYLREHGLELLACNVRTHYGEIDLVMKQGQELVFVEVKARTNDTYGMPEAALTENKRAHLLAAIEAYLLTQDQPESQWRVDVVSVRGKPGETDVEITWFENALA
jgi:putative endonuclease